MSLAMRWPWVREGEDPMLYLDDVFRYAMARLGQREEAEDVAVEVVESLPSPCRRDNLRLYMIGMARRKVADRLRKQPHEQAMCETDAPFRFDRISDEATVVADVLRRLTPDHREVLALKYISDLTTAEVGRIMRRSPEAINSLLQRARQAFEREWTLLSSDEVTK